MNPHPKPADTFGADFLPRCERALQQLSTDVHDLFSAMVSTADGFELVAINHAGGSSRLAALSSSLLAVSQAAMRELKLAGSGSVLIENDSGKMLIVEARTLPHRTVLCVAAGPQAMTGKLLWAAKRCVQAMST
jgi:predicted regulator of Ras-like GTPase activity (Roadblock/LC7/MglB family)